MFLLFRFLYDRLFISAPFFPFFFLLFQYEIEQRSACLIYAFYALFIAFSDLRRPGRSKNCAIVIIIFFAVNEKKNTPVADHRKNTTNKKPKREFAYCLCQREVKNIYTAILSTHKYSTT